MGIAQKREITINSLPARSKRSKKEPEISSKRPALMVPHPIKYFRRHRRRVIRYGLVAGNLLIVLVAVVLVLKSSGGNAANYSALNTAEEAKESNPLDTLSATDIAVHVALMTRLPETGLIINEADSVNAGLNATESSHETVLKPQILSPSIKTKADIVSYTTVEGDTLASLAQKFGVTSDSIRWSNSMSGTRLAVGTTLLIPPVDGIVYTVKSGDSAEALANRYNVNKDVITRFNDAEITGLVAGDRIVIPGGSIRAVAPSRTPYYAGFAFGNTAIYGYNGYVPGYCTWYVANKRAQIGRPLPANLGNASTWDNYAPQGWDRVPRVGAAVVTAERGAGHVAFVEQVNPDGSVLVSEMNRRRRYEVTTRVFSPAEAGTYKYIH